MPNYKAIYKIWLFDQNGNKIALDYRNVIRHNYTTRNYSANINGWFNDDVNALPPYGAYEPTGLVEIQLPADVTSVSSAEIWAWGNTSGAGKVLVYVSEEGSFDYDLKGRWIFSAPSEKVSIPLDGSGFEPVKVGNKYLHFVKVLYVDPVSGDDAGSGTSSSPLKTISAAVDRCEDAGYAIFALGGTHDVTHISTSYGTGGLYDAGKSIAFIGNPGKTVFLCDGVKNTRRDQHAICTYGIDTRVYQVIFDVKLNGRTIDYHVAVFGRDNYRTNCRVYNCVFVYDGRPSIVYDNENINVIEVYNSTFIVTGDFLRSYSGGTRPKLTNCATNRAFYSEGTKVTCANYLLFDSQYRIKSDESLWKDVGTGTDLDGSIADLGVYGGEYSWYKDLEIIILTPNVSVPKNTDVQFSYQITAPQPIDLTLLTPMSKMSLDDGNMFLSEDIDLRFWLEITRLEVN